MSALTLPRTLDQLVDESQTVVQGRVISVLLQKHDKLPELTAVSVTLQVEDSLKGSSGSGSFTFSQAVLDRRDLQQTMGYRAGQRLLLIMMKPSSFGLSSPAGMQQGRFQIQPGLAGTLVATNGFGNSGLFRGLDARLRSRGVPATPELQSLLSALPGTAAPLDALKSVIRSIVGTTPRP